MKLLQAIRKRVVNIWKFNIQSGLVYFFNVILSKKLVEAIVIESHDDFDSNGGAMYDYLINNSYQTKYTIVLFLHHKLDRILPNRVVAYRLYRPSFYRAFYSCRAKFLFADNFSHKKMQPNQTTVYMSHGIPIKNTRGHIVLPPTTDYCLSPSTFYDKYIRIAFMIENTNVKMLHLGYPRLDVLFDSSNGDLYKLTSKKYNKRIIWMPTFRKGGSIGRNDSECEQPLGIPLINTLEEYDRLNKYLKDLDTLLIIKIHPKQDMSTLKITGMSNIIVLTEEDAKKKDISNFRLYKDMDAMISDYSSASFDYMNLDRPICYDFSDINHYKLGLVVENPDEFLPGKRINDMTGLFSFIKEISNNIDSYSQKRTEVLDKMFEYRDGNSCERIIKFLGI